MKTLGEYVMRVPKAESRTAPARFISSGSGSVLSVEASAMSDLSCSIVLAQDLHAAYVARARRSRVAW